jgi:hypothetical protein
MMVRMSDLFDGTPLERPVTCGACGKPLDQCACSRGATGAGMLPKDQPARIGLEKRCKGKTGAPFDMAIRARTRV